MGLESSGVYPDLRTASAETHDEWNAIVLVCLYYALVGYYFFASNPGGRPASPRE